MKCPKCGFEQPDDIFCASCGVDVTNFRKTKTVKNKNLKLIAGVCGAIVILIIVVLLSGGSDEEEPQRVDDPLTAGDTGIQPSTARTQPLEAPSTVPAETAHPADTKPVEPVKAKCTLVNPSNLVHVPLSGIQGEKNHLRAVSIKEGAMKDIAFQVDRMFDFSGDSKIIDNDTIYFRAEDVGDMDDALAKPAEGQDAYRIHVKNLDGGEGWLYLYDMNRAYTPPSDSYIDYADNPESAHVAVYGAGFSSGGVFEKLELDGADILDRMKIRLIADTAQYDESTVDFENSVFIPGPLLARSQKKGVWNLGEKKIAMAKQVGYFQQNIELTYHFFFEEHPTGKQTLKIYFDFSDAAQGMSLMNSGFVADETVDGIKHEKNTPNGTSFMLSGKRNLIEFNVSGAGTNVFFIDDASIDDPPESSPGCLGCIGFGFENPAGRTAIKFDMVYMSYASDGDSTIIVPQTYIGAMSKLK